MEHNYILIRMLNFNKIMKILFKKMAKIYSQCIFQKVLIVGKNGQNVQEHLKHKKSVGDVGHLLHLKFWLIDFAYHLKVKLKLTLPHNIRYHVIMLKRVALVVQVILSMIFQKKKDLFPKNVGLLMHQNFGHQNAKALVNVRMVKKFQGDIMLLEELQDFCIVLQMLNGN